MNPIKAAIAAASLGLLPCHAEVITFSNQSGTFVWKPALSDPLSGDPILAERMLDITISAADNQASLADPYRSLSYFYSEPQTSSIVIVDRVTRIFPDGRAGIDTGEFFNYGTDTGFYVRNYLPGESVLPAQAIEAFPTNAGLVKHTADGHEPVLGDRITIGIRYQADQVGKSHYYGYVVLEWRESVQFQNLTGGTSTLNMYQPVEWAYETTPDTPITIPDTPDCPADTNLDGMLTPADFTAWIAAFNAQAPECDQNGDALCTPADFTAWIANFNAGC